MLIIEGMEEKSKKIKTRELLKVIFWNIKYSLKIAPLFYIGLFLTNLFQNLIPIALTFSQSLILQEIINSIGNNNKEISKSLIIFIIIWSVFGVINQINNIFFTYFYIRLNQKYDQMLMANFLEKKASLDIEHLENPKLKIIEEKATEAVHWRYRQLNIDFFRLVSNIISLIFLGGIFLTINPIFLILVLIPVGINYYTNRKYGYEVYGIYDFKGDEKKDTYHSQDSLNNIDVLKEAKIYGFSKYLIERYKSTHNVFMKIITEKLNKKYSVQFISVIFDNLVFAFIQIWLITNTLLGKITVGNYSFYLLNINQVAGNLYNIQDSFTSTLDLAQYVSDYKNYLELGKKVLLSKNPISVENIAPEIEFRNISFKYPNSKSYTLKNLSFKLNSGEKVSLVGENGAGKSTIIKLLARFYDPTEGEILINGENLKNLDLKSYYKLWGVLFQYFARYWFTVKENIGIGNIDDMNNLEMIKEAGEKAGIGKILEKLPKGYDNMLSTDFSDGKDLSGGEWQKIGIARGMFARPKFIVLDEPTSALDALAEAKVFREIEKIAKDTTMLIVSHRFATVRNADKILVLENGEITEQGSHDELMENKGLYHKMFTSQAEGYR